MPNSYGGSTAANESSEQTVFSSGPLPPWATVTLTGSVPFSWECIGAGAPWTTQGNSEQDGAKFTANVFAGWTMGFCVINVKASGQQGTVTSSYSFF